MVNGLDEEFKKAKKAKEEMGNIVTKILPVLMLQDIITELLMDYLQEEAKKFSVGLHALHSFEDEETFKMLDYSKEYPIIPKVIIAYGIVCSILLDAIMIYLSAGGSLAVKGAAKSASLMSKLKRTAKGAYRVHKNYKTLKKITTLNYNVAAEPDFSGVEFIPPALARSTGFGYVVYSEGAVNLELTERIVASPLLALRYGVKFGIEDVVAVLAGITSAFNSLEVTNNIIGEILSINKLNKSAKKTFSTPSSTPSAAPDKKDSVGEKIIKKKRNRQDFLNHTEKHIKRSIKDFLDKIGQKGDFEIYFSGYIDANYEFRHGGDQGLALDIYDEQGNKKTYKNKTGLTYGTDYGIVVGVKFSLSSTVTLYWSKLNAYTPRFLGDGLSDTTASFELEGELGGSIYYEKTYIRNGPTATMKIENIIFTGIRGSVFVKIEVKGSDKSKGWVHEAGKKTSKDASATVQDKYIEEYTELLEGFTIPFEPTPVFDDSLKKYFTK